MSRNIGKYYAYGVSYTVYYARVPCPDNFLPRFYIEKGPVRTDRPFTVFTRSSCGKPR